MAEFNPLLPNPSNPDGDKGYMNYSQGSLPVRGTAGKQFVKEASFGEQVAGLFGDIARATDFVVQEYIEGNLREQTDEIRNEFSVGDAAVFGASASQQPQPAPQGLQQAGQNLEGLTAAYQSGRLKEIHYWARLESMVRQMKNRFPGYVDEIDTHVAKLTGSVPANVIRRELQAEAEAAAQAGTDLEKRRMNQIEDMAKDGSLALVRDWANASWEELVAVQTSFSADKANRDRRIAQYNLKDKEGKADKEELLAIAKDDVQNMTASIFKTGLGSQNMTYDQLISEIEQERKDVLSGTNVGLSPAEIQAQARALKTAWEQNVDQMIVQNYSGLTADQQEELKKPGRDLLDNLIKDVEDGNYALLKGNAMILEMQADADSRELMKDPAFRFVGATRTSLGPEIANSILARPEGAAILSRTTEAVQNAITESSIMTGDRSADNYFEALKQAGEKGEAAYTSQVQKWSSLLVDPQIPAANKENLVRTLFGDRNQQMLAKFPAPVRFKMWKQLTAPEVQQAMIQHKAQDPEGWEMYKSWAVYNAQNHMLKDAAKIQEGVVYRDLVNFSFDERTGKLRVTDQNPITGASTFRDSYERDQAQKVKAALSRVNTVLDGLTPLFEADGESVPQELESLVRNMGVSPEDQKQGPFYASIYNAIANVSIDLDPTGEAAARRQRIIDFFSVGGKEQARKQRAQADADDDLEPQE